MECKYIREWFLCLVHTTTLQFSSWKSRIHVFYYGMFRRLNKSEYLLCVVWYKRRRSRKRVGNIGFPILLFCNKDENL